MKNILELFYIIHMILGVFMPTFTSMDNNSNSRLDILRCKINDSKEAYLELARNQDKMIIEIFREVHMYMFMYMFVLLFLFMCLYTYL
jgi:hypothetical protein